MATTVISEIKDAFPFWWCKRINGIVHTPYEMAAGILKMEMTVTLSGAIRNIEFTIRIPSTQETLLSILDEMFSRYTVKTYQDIRKAGLVEIYIPCESDDFFYMMVQRGLVQKMPISINFELYKLPFLLNRFNKKQVVVVPQFRPSIWEKPKCFFLLSGGK
jgi:hypothetical protein